MAGTSLRLHIETEDREYPSMYKLKLQGKDLENVPAELFTLRELEVLCMSPDRQSSLNYKLCNVPPEIGYLTRLRILLLDTNDLHNLPAEIGSLTRLEKLSVSNNRIRQLPPTIGDLKNLHTLHLANNQLQPFQSVTQATNQLYTNTRICRFTFTNRTSFPYCFCSINVRILHQAD
ncbi:hypothetical protein CRM22_006014 [Opisthorchis felineus]|uniref:Disease resistance R13L4/SHOC-2-like LRR domain-containing protein n=1 Tax=Opisthorchis felineus TaxID=147828 RepID=A0A4S2LN21_OPIFE|nr:hypothetical protein CRM22_006014 [Opisthorchis felineus]